MTWNGFASLNLSNVEAASYTPLEPGMHHVKCTGAEIKDIMGGKRLVLNFDSLEGKGQVTEGLNIVNRNPQAQEIALRELKAFLIAGGHPNPDRPGDIKTLIGLKCWIYADYGKPYMKEGKEVRRVEIKRFVLPGEGDGQSAPSAAPAGSAGRDIDDEIPF